MANTHLSELGQHHAELSTGTASVSLPHLPLVHEEPEAWNLAMNVVFTGICISQAELGSGKRHEQRNRGISSTTCN